MVMAMWVYRIGNYEMQLSTVVLVIFPINNLGGKTMAKYMERCIYEQLNGFDQRTNGIVVRAN